jgi:hypothetical protein
LEPIWLRTNQLGELHHLYWMMSAQRVLIMLPRVPPNCQFEVDDVEETWTFPRNHFDFIHARDFIFSIRDWPKLVGQCFK